MKSMVMEDERKLNMVVDEGACVMMAAEVYISDI